MIKYILMQNLLNEKLSILSNINSLSFCFIDKFIMVMYIC